MTVDTFLSRLDGVRSRGAGKWSSRCPAHADKTPSLSISEGERGVLVRCWAGCSLDEICAALAVTVKDLFTDSLDPDPTKRKHAAQERARRHREIAYRAHQMGTLIDALREADSFVSTRRGLNISTWSYARLNNELDALADAYHLLDHENLYG